MLDVVVVYDHTISVELTGGKEDGDEPVVTVDTLTLAFVGEL
jgi:hypothetical protein